MELVVPALGTVIREVGIAEHVGLWALVGFFMTVPGQGKDVGALSGELDLEDRFALVAGFN